MKKQVIAIALGISTFCSNHALSYYKEVPKQSQATKKPVGIEKAAVCDPATAGIYLQFNDVKAWVENGGSMFLNRQTNRHAYEVPKSKDNEQKRFAIYAGSLWMGGTDVNGQLKLAAVLFRKGNDFWPGPLSSKAGTGNYVYNFTTPQGDGVSKDFGAATITPDQCTAYDKFYSINKAGVLAFNSWWEYTNMPVAGQEAVDKPSNDVLNQIQNWPAHGDVSLGQDYYLAPFYDRDNNGSYNPISEGDYPWYANLVTGRDDKACGVDRRVSLYGDQTYWWVFNDKGNIHSESKGEPIGMEIRAQAFAFSTDDEVNRMTFYNYELINRGTQTLQDTYFSQFLDGDVGNPFDDFAGCDVSRGLGYMYNGDLEDETNAGLIGYGINPPAIGVDFFEGPYKDADGIANGYHPTDLNAAIADGGIVYEGIGIGYNDAIVDNERLGMTRFTYFTGLGALPAYSDPSLAPQYYNYMQGKWANGSNMTYGGNGYGSGTGFTSDTSTYMFPGDSDPLGWATKGAVINGNWTEEIAGNTKGDRRFVQSAGSFTLRPGAVNNITIGIVYGRGFDGDLFSSVRAMKRADTKAQKLFDACFKIFDPPMAPKLTIQELNNELIIMLDNPIASNNYLESYDQKDINIPENEIKIVNNVPVTTLFDQKYKFEGYKIYQLVNSSASVADLLDPTKAQLVAQCDKKNGVTKLINFEFDEGLGFSIPSEKVKGEDKGIKHSFKMTNDAFSKGDRKLVNNKNYYYVAIAYAYNNYKSYSTTDPLLLDGQKKPFVSSRLGFDGGAIRAVEAIPHNPIAESNGTNQRAKYGDTPKIKRLDGTGNGSRNLELTSESENYIVQNGLMNEPEYTNGNGPINVKVVDPLNLADGYFECSFNKYPALLNPVNFAEWTIKRYSKEGGELLDSAFAFVNISVDNEQVITKWGVSVQINQVKYTGTGSSSFTEPITSSMTFSDSSKRWLSVITDMDGFNPMNWIRVGTSDETGPDGSPPYTAPIHYKDEAGFDPSKLYTKLLGGGIAPHRLVGYQSDYMPLAYFGLASGLNPGSIRTNARISSLPSIDIVITSDQSKWTRCPVFELGRNSDFTQGQAKAGGLRKSASVGKDGLPDNSGTTGQGWFPGYAIDVESGARLYMSFGENSFLGQDNGADMVWNPTDRMVDPINFNPIFGGLQPIYIYSVNQKSLKGDPNATAYDFPAYNETANHVYELAKKMENSDAIARNELYSSLTWIMNPILAKDKKLLSSDVRIKVRVNKEYKDLVVTGKNNGRPMYSWNTSDISTTLSSKDKLVEALDLINVVPNPYYAYSEYETGRLDTRVKITNLPDKCTISIYSVNGKLIRSFKKDSQTTSLDWDLNNTKGIPVAGGVYLIHVDVPEVGERILKFFGGMRQVDLQSL